MRLEHIDFVVKYIENGLDKYTLMDKIRLLILLDNKRKKELSNLALKIFRKASQNEKIEIIGHIEFNEMYCFYLFDEEEYLDLLVAHIMECYDNNFRIHIKRYLDILKHGPKVYKVEDLLTHLMLGFDYYAYINVVEVLHIVEAYCICSPKPFQHFIDKTLKKLVDYTMSDKVGYISSVYLQLMEFSDKFATVSDELIELVLAKLPNELKNDIQTDLRFRRIKERYLD